MSSEMEKRGVFVIAEAGVNHNGSLKLAQQLIDAAVDAGADAVKFQSFRADALVSAAAPRASYQARNQPGNDNQLDMLKRLELDETAQHALREHATARGIEFMSTPFDERSLDFLVEQLGMARIKIASGEITNGPFLLRAARKRLPMIVSTGMSTIDEIKEALGVIAFGFIDNGEPRDRRAFAEAYASPVGKSELARRVTLLHCTSDYPAKASEINLRAMETLVSRFSLPVGLSDHSAGIAIPIAAVARGACTLEKHFTLDRTLPGPDHRASLEPKELAAMVSGIRDTLAAIGTSEKAPTPSEIETRPVARRSLVAAREIRKGERIGEDDIAAKRPGTGISPMYYWDWVGRVASKDYQKDDLL